MSAQPLSPQELDEIEARHRLDDADMGGAPSRAEEPGCVVDGQTWPCDAVRLSAAARAALPAGSGAGELDAETLAQFAYEDRPPLGRRPVPWTPVLRREWTEWANRMVRRLRERAATGSAFPVHSSEPNYVPGDNK